MKVVYSIGGCRFANGGIGRTSYYAVAGVHRHHYLHQVIVSDYKPSEIPRELITPVFSRVPGISRIIGSKLGNVINDTLHGYQTARVLNSGDLFHGWAGMSLPALKKARRLGMKTILDRASTHILTAKQILIDEYQRWGVVDNPYMEWSIQRELEEYELADYIFIPSEFAYDSFIQNGVSPEKLRLVRFGVNPIPPEVTLMQPGQSDKFNAIFVGEVGFRKGILYALEAWQQVQFPNKGVFYVVGPILEAIKPFLGKYAEDPSIEIVGYADSRSYYLRSSVFIFPSLEEGSALVTFEAMAYGLPVITTYNSGSVVKDGQEGRLIDIRDVHGLIAAIESIAQGYENMSNQAKLTARRNSWEDYGERIVSEYEKIFN